MGPDFTRLRAKFAYLLARDDVALPANVYERWNPEGLREALDDGSRAPADRLMDALAGRTMGVLRFHKAADRYELTLDEFETGRPTDQSWFCIGESEMATTTAILVHSRTGETVLYDSDAWDWGFKDALVLEKDSMYAFVDEVLLGPDYRLLYYQNWVEQMAVEALDDLEYPGMYCDPWYLLLRELHADRSVGRAVSRDRRAELLRRIDAYHEWEPDEAVQPLLRRSAPFDPASPWGPADNAVAAPLARWRAESPAPADAWPDSDLLPLDLSIAFTAYLETAHLEAAHLDAARLNAADLDDLDAARLVTAAPDTAHLETAHLDTAAPDTAHLDTGIPDTAHLDTGIPDTAHLDTAAPDTAHLVPAGPERARSAAAPDGGPELFAPLALGGRAFPVLGRPPGLEPRLFVLDLATGAVHLFDLSSSRLEPVNASLALFHRFLVRFARFAAEDDGEATRPDRAAALEAELKALDPVGFGDRDHHWSLVMRILSRTLAD